MKFSMIRADLDMRSMSRWSKSRGYMRDPDFAMHHLLTECFGSEHRIQPFRVIADRRSQQGTLLGYCQSDQDSLREIISIVADPLQSRIIRPETIDEKPMPPEWIEGKRLGFEVRVRPTKRTKKFRTHGPKVEKDVYVSELDKPVAMRRPRTEVYAEWLDERCRIKGGAIIHPESVRLGSYRQTKAVRIPRTWGIMGPEAVMFSLPMVTVTVVDRTWGIMGPEAVMYGTLTITDGDKFAELVSGGVGRHKPYGYGMILLRPIVER